MKSVNFPNFRQNFAVWYEISRTGDKIKQRVPTICECFFNFANIKIGNSKLVFK